MSRRTGGRTAIRGVPLQLVEPAALSLVVLPVALSSHIHLPASLRSPGITRLQRYYERSDSCLAALRILSAAAISLRRETAGADHELRSVPDRSLCVMCSAFLTIPTPTTLDFNHRFCTLPLSVITGRGFSIWASPLASGLAKSTGRIEFTKVWDWSFAFRCSPPRLTATQFRSATSRRTST